MAGAWVVDGMQPPAVEGSC